MFKLSMRSCYCCSGKPFADCCEPFLRGTAQAPDAQSLMRSRFSAYCTKNYDYVLATYGVQQRVKLTSDALATSADNIKWLALEIVAHRLIDDTNARVEFVATYTDAKTLYQMHELSGFELQDDVWRYTTGVMKEKTGKLKIKRNDRCFCQSGKKFKQCCMNRV